MSKLPREAFLSQFRHCSTVGLVAATVHLVCPSMHSLHQLGRRGLTVAARRAACLRTSQQMHISCRQALRSGDPAMSSSPRLTNGVFAVDPPPRVHDSAQSEAGNSQGVMQQARPRRPVVTAFIRRDDGKLLVVKRSDMVSTYQQHWGGVSGGVEGSESLLDRALTEILEEVGLAPQQLQLVCFGRPLPVDDGRKHFLVYPFLFQLVDPAAQVTLNWENVGYDWVPPSGIPQLQHVPLLPETVRRLLLPPYMQQHVDYLKTDRQHGAAQLAAYVTSAVRAALVHEEKSAQQLKNGGSSSSGGVGANVQQQQLHGKPVQPTFDGFMEAYSNFCFHMAVARPSMAAVANAAADVMLQLQREVAARADAFEPTVGLARLALSDTVNKLIQQLQQQQSATVANTAAVIQPGMCVMTTSLSSTVAAALIKAQQEVLAAAAAEQGSEQPASLSPGQPEQQHAQQSAISAAVSVGASPDVPASSAHTAGRTSSRGNYPSSIDFQSWDEADVDDPNFWPSSSGIGRQQGTNSSWVAALGARHRARLAAAGGPGSSTRPSDSSQQAGISGISVVVCESRPLCEGAIMARQLAAAGLDVTLITDAQAGVFIDKVDLLLLGADAVTPAGVVNKVGSRLMALAAKAAEVPVAAVTDSLKLSPGPVSVAALPNTHLSAGEEEKEVQEVLTVWDPKLVQQLQAYMQPGKHSSEPLAGVATAEAPAGPAQPAAEPQTGDSGAAAQPSGSSEGNITKGSISIRNVYFESVPLDLLSALVTDKGVLTSAHVAHMIKQRVKDYQKAFGLTVPGDMLSS